MAGKGFMGDAIIFVYCICREKKNQALKETCQATVRAWRVKFVLIR